MPAGGVQRQVVKANIAPMQPGIRPAAPPMQEKFERTPNYAAFIQDAMQRPEEGGRFFATLAYIRCQEVAAIKLAVADSGAEHADRRESARQEILALKQRCAGVAAQFPSELTFMAAIKQANSRGAADKLLAPGGLLPAKSREAAMAEIQRARGSGSSYLTAAALEINVEHFAEALSPAFANGHQRDVLFRAAAATACEITGTCLESLWVLVPCMREGDCEQADLRDFLRAGLDQASQQLFDETRRKIAGLGIK